MIGDEREYSNYVPSCCAEGTPKRAMIKNRFSSFLHNALLYLSNDFLEFRNTLNERDDSERRDDKDDRSKVLQT